MPLFTEWTKEEMNTCSSAAEELSPQNIPQRDASGRDVNVLTDIYRDAINIAIWQRTLSERLGESVVHVVNSRPLLKTSAVVSPTNVNARISDILGTEKLSRPLCDDISDLVEMYCFLFDVKEAGLRLTSLDRAMCPRFHVDRVLCRLMTTYQGNATQWLPDHLADRTKLGQGNNGEPDEKSGLMSTKEDIRHLERGDVALLKGALWQGNESGGIIHRSPPVATGERRLILTLDFHHSGQA